MIETLSFAPQQRIKSPTASLFLATGLFLLERTMKAVSLGLSFLFWLAYFLLVAPVFLLAHLSPKYPRFGDGKVR